MGWLELLAWLRVLNKQVKGAQTTPESWENSEQDPWWAEQRRIRDEERRG